VAAAPQPWPAVDLPGGVTALVRPAAGYIVCRDDEYVDKRHDSDMWCVTTAHLRQFEAGRPISAVLVAALAFIPDYAPTSVPTVVSSIAPGMWGAGNEMLWGGDIEVLDWAPNNVRLFSTARDLDIVDNTRSSGYANGYHFAWHICSLYSYGKRVTRSIDNWVRRVLDPCIVYDIDGMFPAGGDAGHTRYDDLRALCANKSILTSRVDAELARSVTAGAAAGLGLLVAVVRRNFATNAARHRPPGGWMTYCNILWNLGINLGIHFSDEIASWPMYNNEEMVQMRYRQGTPAPLTAGVPPGRGAEGKRYGEELCICCSAPTIAAFWYRVPRDDGSAVGYRICPLCATSVNASRCYIGCAAGPGEVERSRSTTELDVAEIAAPVVSNLKYAWLRTLIGRPVRRYEAPIIDVVTDAQSQQPCVTFTCTNLKSVVDIEHLPMFAHSTRTAILKPVNMVMIEI
jgi:hypothetical protein